MISPDCRPFEGRIISLTTTGKVPLPGQEDSRATQIAAIELRRTRDARDAVVIIPPQKCQGVAVKDQISVQELPDNSFRVNIFNSQKPKLSWAAPKGSVFIT